MKFLPLCFLALLPSPLLAESWPNMHGLNRSSVSSETGLIDQLPEAGAKILWETKLEAGFSGVSIDKGEIFVMDRDPGESDALLCLDLATGEEKWRYEYEIKGKLSFSGSRNVPTIANDRIYTIGGFGHVHCIDRDKKEPVWSFDTMATFDIEMSPKWGYAQSPLLIDGKVIIGVFSDEIGLAALNATSGELVWQTEAIGTSMSQPVAMELGGAEQLLILSKWKSTDGGEESGQLTALNPSDGNIQWKSDQYYNKWPIPVPVKIGDDKLLLTGGYGCGSAMMQLEDRGGGAFTMKELYRLEGGSQIHPPIVVGEHLYLMLNENANYKTRIQREESGGLACLELGTGKEVWRTGNAPYFGRGNIIMADSKLIIQDGHSGMLRIVEPSPEAYQQKGEANVFNVPEDELGDDGQRWSPMALSDGHLVMRGQDKLVCVDLRK